MDCKHERCEWVRFGGNAGEWRFKIETSMGTAVDAVGFCPDCGTKLEPPQATMTLEEVARSVGEVLDCYRVPTANLMRIWHRAITAHLEGEPKGLEHNTAKADAWAIKQAYELLRQLGTSTRTVYYDERAACVRVAGLLEPIAARHTKGGKA